MKNQKTVFWLESGKRYTDVDIFYVCYDYGMFGRWPDEMSDADIDRFEKKYMNEDLGIDSELDPSGGYGLHSHI